MSYMLSSHIDFALWKCLIMAFQMNELIKLSHANIDFDVKKNGSEKNRKSRDEAPPKMMEIGIYLNESDGEEIGKKEKELMSSTWKLASFYH